MKIGKRIEKTVLMLGLLLLVAYQLSGCGHTHQWQAASCEAPKTCTNCGETEGEALGHSWETASCEKPETCSVCGKTQGEALGHEMECVSFTKEDYIQVCTVCEKEETVAIEDWAAFANSLIVGEWRIGKMYTGEAYFDLTIEGITEMATVMNEEAPDPAEVEAYVREMESVRFVFREDGTGSETYEGEVREFLWRYTGEYTNSITSENGLCTFYGTKDPDEEETAGSIFNSFVAEDGYNDLLYIDGHNAGELSYMVICRLVRV